MDKNPIVKSFKDLDVYHNAYNAMLTVYREIIPNLPRHEEYDLKDQLRRSVKAIPRLIGEGYSKRHQFKGFQKYIYDAHAESNETIVSLSQVRDLYGEFVKVGLCEELIDSYDKISRQLFKLAQSWNKYNNAKRITQDDSRYASDRRMTIRRQG